MDVILTVSTARKSSRRTEEKWGPAAGLPPGFCSRPDRGGAVYSKGTVQPWVRCPPRHFHKSPAQRCLAQVGGKNTLRASTRRYN